MAELREVSGLTRAEMAVELGWSEIRLYRLETGWTRPRAEDVEAFARVLERPVADLYGEAAA